MYKEKKLNFLGYDSMRKKYIRINMRKNGLKMHHLEFAEKTLCIMEQVSNVAPCVIIAPTRSDTVTDLKEIFIHFLASAGLKPHEISAFLVSKHDRALSRPSIWCFMKSFDEKYKKDKFFKELVSDIMVAGVELLLKDVPKKEIFPRLHGSIPFDEKTGMYSRDKNILAGISLKKLKDIEHVLGIISKITKLKMGDIISANQERKFVDARRMYNYFLRKKFKFSLYLCGRFFSSRKPGSHRKDHATIYHAVRSHKQLIDSNDKRYTALFQEVMNIFQKKARFLEISQFEEYSFRGEEIQKIALINNMNHLSTVSKDQWFSYEEFLLLLYQNKTTDPIITNTMMRNPDYFIKKQKEVLIPVFST